MHHIHIDLHKIHFIKNELQEVYLNLVIQSFALSLISIFVPIYLIQLGYTLNQALIFVMIEMGVLSFFTPFSVMFAKRYGFKHIILYSTPLLILYFLGLYLLNNINIPIYAIALSGGVAASMYWMSLHSLFAKHSDKIHRGMQAGKFASLKPIAALFGPSIGGIIAVSLGFNALFAIAILVLCLSVIPLLFTGDMKPHVKHFSYKKMFSKNNLPLILAFAAQGVIMVMGTIIWPVFVYFTLNDVASVGFAGTITAVGTIIFILYIGKLTDSVRRLILLKIGGILLASTFFLRIFARNITRIFIISFLAGLFTVIIEVPMLSIFYDKASQENLAEIVVLRQMALGVGRVGSILLLLWTINKFTIGFSMGGIASLIFSLF